MHFKPGLNRARQTCARVRIHNTSLKITLNGQKLSNVKSAKFLGVVIDDQLSWGPKIEYLVV